MSIRVNQKSYKCLPPVPGPLQFPRGELGTSMSMAGSCIGARGMGCITAVSIQHVEQQNKILGTKWSLLQQQKIVWSNMDSIVKSYINNFRQQLDTLGQEKLKVAVDLEGLDVEKAYINKRELESPLDVPTDEIDMSMVLSMDNSHSLAQYEDTASCSWAEAKAMYQIKYEELQTLARNHGANLPRTKMEFSEMNQNITWASLEVARVDTEEHKELDIKDAHAKLAKATLWAELGYRGLRSPGLNYNLSSFQSSLGSGGGSSSFHGSSSNAIDVKKIMTRDGKLVFESSNVLLSN
ncbi:unnamed protein product [Nyctereutes procyonoides]|uniref:Keratin, type II cytoskeletal 8 n=1 Tax=Nyctereutes procyonoides TaxID=34880 RepID=A0A811ZP59_NYCPR|nr:unnamed protein product [Nyctereutes procyonoides]